MSYVGNPSLNEETKARILTTFGQTKQLATSGRLQEAALGCDFILKMDGHFTPARALLDRLDGATGPVDVSGLESGRGAGSPPPAPAEALGSLPPLPASEAPTAGGASVPLTDAQTVFAEPPSLGGELDLLDGPAPDAAGATSTPGFPAPPPAPSPSASPAFGAEPAPSITAPSLAAPSIAAPSIADPSIADPPPLGAPSLSAPQGGNGDDDRVVALLQEGQASFEAGAHQAAIDAWSRIFLIDIDHEEASRRIEAARRLKDESERALEERFHGAIDRIEAGELVEGRALLEEVLVIQPEHVGAQERLRALDSVAASALHDPEADPQTDGLSGSTQSDFGGLSSESGVVGAKGAREEHLSAPSFGTAAAPAAAGASGPKPKGARKRGRFAERRFLVIGAGALLVVLGICGFLYVNWDSLFSNRSPVERPDVPIKLPDPMVDANRRHISGDVEGAIAILERVPESSARYQQARQQIEEWRQELLTAEAEVDAAEAGQRDAAQRRLSLLESARRLYAEGEFFLAAKEFNAAAKIEPLDGPTSELFEDSKRQLLPIQQQITLFREGEWQRMQAPLWRILEGDPQNRDARGLLVDSYYNIGVQALRSGTPAEAVEPLRESDRLRPLDPMVERLLLLAVTYTELGTLDSLYSIFVEELSYRR